MRVEVLFSGVFCEVLVEVGRLTTRARRLELVLSSYRACKLASFFFLALEINQHFFFFLFFLVA